MIEHRLVRFATAIILASASAGCSSAPALGERDSVLVADEINTTGDPMFDAALKPAVSVALQQTPFLTLLSDQRVQRTSRAMKRAPDAPLSGDAARELCQRAGATAVVQTSIESSNTAFLITLVVTQCQSGAQLANQQGQAPTRDAVLEQLDNVVKSVRHQLGEPAATLRQYNAPLVRATSSSLDALQAYGYGLRARALRGDDAAIPFFQRAIERDPAFGLAYAKLGVVTGNAGLVAEARDATKKAYEHRDAMTEYERLYIDWNHASRVLGDQKAVRNSLERLTTTYPRDFAARNNFGVYYNNNGEFEEALTQYTAASAIAPDEPGPISNSAYVLLMLRRYDEASDAVDRALAIRPEPNLAITRWNTARALDLPRAAEFEKVARSLARADQVALADASLAAWFGQFQAFQKMQDALIARARHAGNTDLADGVAMGRLITLAAYRRGRDLDALKAAAARETNPIFLAQQVSALAMLGELDSARSGLKRLGADPKNETTLGPPLTVARAYVQAKDGQAPAALAALQAAVASLPRARDLYYFMADIREQTGDIDGAIAGYRTVIDSLTYIGPNPLIPAAHLKLAKILLARNDPAGAKTHLDALLKQWKGADGEFPALTEARVLRAKIGD